MSRAATRAIHAGVSHDARDLRPRDARDRMIVALDLASVAEARRLIAALGEGASFYKIGMQLVFAGGLSLIDELARAGKRVFLDMKLLDINNTVAGAVESIARLDVTLTTIHAYPKAMRAAVAALRQARDKHLRQARGKPANGPGLLAVTVLTSMDDTDVARAGYSGDALSLVKARAADARDAGMDGTVCSPREAEIVRAIVGKEMLIVTPGVRSAGSAAGDQKRTLTPGEAIAAGADYVVVGRPVTAAADPAVAAKALVKEIEKAL